MPTLDGLESTRATRVTRAFVELCNGLGFGGLLEAEHKRLDAVPDHSSRPTGFTEENSFKTTRLPLASELLSMATVTSEIGEDGFAETDTRPLDETPAFMQYLVELFTSDAEGGELADEDSLGASREELDRVVAEDGQERVVRSGGNALQGGVLPVLAAVVPGPPRDVL